MENLLDEIQNSPVSEVVLNDEVKQHLDGSRKWTLFLAILGSVFMGLFVLAAFVMFIAGSVAGSQAGFPVGLLGVVYLVLAGVYFLPIVYLYKYTYRIKMTLRENNSLDFTEAMKSMKNHFKSIGIITIVMAGLYIVGIIVAVIVGFSNLFPMMQQY